MINQFACTFTSRGCLRRRETMWRSMWLGFVGLYGLDGFFGLLINNYSDPEFERNQIARELLTIHGSFVFIPLKLLVIAVVTPVIVLCLKKGKKSYAFTILAVAICSSLYAVYHPVMIFGGLFLAR